MKSVLIFLLLVLIVACSEKIKSNVQVINYDYLYEESVAEVQKMQDDIELQIRLDNERRASEYAKQYR